MCHDVSATISCHTTVRNEELRVFVDTLTVAPRRRGPYLEPPRDDFLQTQCPSLWYLAQVLINVTVKYGQESASDVLPYPVTTARNLAVKYSNIKDNVKVQEIRSH
jgi:hypothetical protein